MGPTLVRVLTLLTTLPPPQRFLPHLRPPTIPHLFDPFLPLHLLHTLGQPQPNLIMPCPVPRAKLHTHDKAHCVERQTQTHFRIRGLLLLFLGGLGVRLLALLFLFLTGSRDRSRS